MLAPRLPHLHHHHHHHPEYHHVTVDGTGTTSYPSPARYEHVVLGLLQRIHHTHTGHAVFREFELRSHHSAKVIPLEGVFNAFAQADDYLHATAKGQVERSGANGQILLDASGKPIVGQGGGSDTKIKFTPLTFSNYCSTGKRGHKSGAHPDEVLIHEMIHAMREMRGIFDPVPLGHLYDTEEEFFAILIANVYASETHRAIDIRSDHHGFTHLLTDTDATFLPKKDETDYRYRLVGKLVHAEPRLTRELAKVRAAFNPFRRYFELQHSHHAIHH